jgi:asparagine synthase (glutamine-hydrolysing)
MCGFSGLVGDFVPALMDRMNAVQRHRGPDGDGVFEDEHAECGLGHVRLAILDPTPRASQPMISADGRYVLSYNGEIYNFRELRKELEACGRTFHSTGDTEVLLHGLSEFGEEFVSRLNGMFAFALWDRDTRELLIARDPMGVKPLYYCVPRPGTVLFASEMKALLEYPGFNPVPDFTALVQHLVFCHASADRTALKGVKRLPAGHLARWSANDRVLRNKRYWSPPEADYAGIRSDAVTQLRYSIAAAVQRQMVSDVPVGVFLSGGLDSSYITTLSKPLADSRFTGFNVNFADSENRLDQVDADLPHARNLADTLGMDLQVTELHHSVADLWSRLVWHLDEPLVDPAAIATYLVCKQAREFGTPVLLSGQGADELFCGYPRYWVMRTTGWIESLPTGLRAILANAVNLLPAAMEGGAGVAFRRVRRALRGVNQDTEHRFLDLCSGSPQEGVLGVLSPAFIEELDKQTAFDDCLAQLRSSTFNGLARFRERDLSVYLPNHNLLYTDKMGMAVGVEARVPYLDMEVVEQTLRFPIDWLLRGTQTKVLFRKCAQGTVTDSIIRRKKAGFTAPYRKWLRYDLEEMWNDVLSERAVRNRGWFNYDSLQRARQKSQAGTDDLYMLQWAALTLELWARHFLDGKK